MHEPIEDRFSEGAVTDAGVPLVGRQLADHHGRMAAVTVVHDLQQIVALGG